MRLYGLGLVEEFASIHPEARAPLSSWKLSMSAGRFASFADLKRVYRSADYVKPLTIFDVGGNKYRLIAKVDYDCQATTITAVLTHAEYDRWSPRR